MGKLFTRGSFIKMAAVSVVALVFVLFTTGAAFDTSTVSAVLNFGPRTLDSFTFKGKFDSITSSNDPTDFKITLTVENIFTGEKASWEGPPTQLR